MIRQLTEEDIASIRRIYENLDITQKALAELFHVGQPYISRLVRDLRRKVNESAV